MRLGTFRRKPGVRFDRGFTLIEVMVGVLVISIVFFALYSGMTLGLKRVAVATEDLRATQILNEKMETIRLYTWDQITSTNFIPSTFEATYFPLGQSSSQSFTYDGTMTIGPGPADVSYSNSLKTVTVLVTWTMGSITHNREVNTYVARNGLQAYIY